MEINPNETNSREKAYEYQELGRYIFISLFLN